MAWAFVLVGMLGQSQAAAWKAVSGWGEPRTRWITLDRWALAVRHRRLFPGLLGVALDASAKQVAARVAQVVRSLSPRRGTVAEEVFAGAAYVAHGC